MWKEGDLFILQSLYSHLTTGTLWGGTPECIRLSGDTGLRGRGRNHYPCFSPILIWSTPKYAKEERRAELLEVVQRLFLENRRMYELIGWLLILVEKINTAYIERFNLTIRNSLARFIRRGMNCRKTEKCTRGLWFLSAWYNFVKPHHSLRLEVNSGRKKWIQRTPAMRGITDTCMESEELREI